ncbi:MAG: hypothetical protein LQ348_004107 [Seirophora lacunosa]|nr:MAG: hypothetical protein LQ344_005831 [Seirophora lacunosa]KAI4187324.1 MAG: hypothetical protein LQ348_004107 [Seirophora lacunosa]
MLISEFHQVAPSSDSRNGQIMYPPLEHDFDSFPPAVKRKYFSSLERLRLAQRPGTSDSCTTSTCFLSHTRPVTRSSRPRLQIRNSSYFKNSPSRLMRKASAPSDCFSFEDAQWFQSLPVKVQRKQFTTEEQEVLARRRESWILDAADEVILRAFRQRFHSLPTLQPSSSYSSASSVHTLEDLEGEPAVDSAIDMDESILDGFRWINDDDDLDLTLDDYHSHLVSSTAPVSRHGSRRPSFRRTLSLTAMPAVESHRPVSPERDPRTTSSIPPPRTSSPRDRSRPRTGHRDASIPRHAPLQGTDQPTKHYQDPEARLKLRVYLASPSKFDEALEFGFPSLESREHLPQPRRPSISRQNQTEPAPQTFYDSENPSFLDGPDSDSDDAESLPEMDAPHTPSDAVFSHNTHRLPMSKPSCSELDRPLPKAVGRFIYKQVEQAHHHQPYIVSGCNREMTLRMTLTRPDLRASDDLLYGHSDSDPLALEHLPTAVGNHDIWDQGKESGGAVRKLWRKVSGRC